MNLTSRVATALFALTLGSVASAQITVTNAVFPVAGDTLRMAVDYAPAAGTVVLGPPGFGENWDFSGLQVVATQSTIYRATGAVPGAELVATTTLNMSPTTVTWYGSGSGQSRSGFPRGQSFEW